MTAGNILCHTDENGRLTATDPGTAMNHFQRAAQLDPDFGQGVLPPDLRDLAIHHEPSLVNQSHPVAQRLDHVHLMGGEDRRTAGPPR